MDLSTRQTMLDNGDVQIASDLSFSNSFLTERSEHTYVKYLPPVAVIYVMNAAKGPLIDSKVRRALSLAIDRENLIANVVNGAAQPLLGFVSQVHFGAGKVGLPKRDLVLTKKLLEEAGHKNGLTLEVDCPLR